MNRILFGRRAVFRLALAVALAWHAGAADGSAQLIEGRPFRALFRTVANPADSRHQIDLFAFLSAGRDEIGASLGDSENLLDPRLRTATYGGLTLRTRYAHQGRRSTFGIDGGLTSRYYSSLATVSLMNAFGGIHWSTGVGSRGRLTLGQRVTYSPYQSYGVRPVEIPDAPDEPFEPPTDQRVLRLETYGYDTRFGYEHQLGRHSYLVLDYDFHYVDITPRTPGDVASDLISHRPGIRFRRELGRYASFNLGYGLLRAEYTGADQDAVMAQDVAAGIGYSRPLSFSRRTRVGFSAGSTIVAEDSTRVHLIGSAFLSHALSRTWNAVLAYHRGMDVREGYTAPFFFFSDAITGSLGGRLAGPVTVHGRASFANGRFALDSLQNRSDSFLAFVALQVPITTMVGALVQGHYNDYAFQRRLGLLSGVPLETSSYGVRVGLNLWLPVLR